MSARILIVDDEKLIRWSLRERLGQDGYHITEAENVSSAIALLQSEPFEAALLDLKLPDGTGLDILRAALAAQPGITALIITAHSSVDSAIEAMKEGAYDYIGKPFNMDELSITLRRALESRRLQQTWSAEVQQKKRDFGLNTLIGTSKAFEEVKVLIQRVARADTTSVLLLGETGTGKDVAARAIHYESARADKPFMNITCTAMPESLIESELFGHEAGAFTNATGLKTGLFELAHTGTVFLDEIGDMPANLQAKLLRVLEEKSFRRIGGNTDIEVDCRIIAATHRDLQSMIQDGTFREDLFYRLSAVPIELPSLQERREDIALLSEYFFTRFQRQRECPLEGIRDTAQQALDGYAWPGNIRELRNVLERAVLLAPGPYLEPTDILLAATPIQPAIAGITLPPEGCDLATVERELLEQALSRSGGNQTHAAGLLGLSRDQVRYKMKKYNLDSD